MGYPCGEKMILFEISTHYTFPTCIASINIWLTKLTEKNRINKFPSLTNLCNSIMLDVNSGNLNCEVY